MSCGRGVSISNISLYRLTSPYQSWKDFDDLEVNGMGADGQGFWRGYGPLNGGNLGVSRSILLVRSFARLFSGIFYLHEPWTNQIIHVCGFLECVFERKMKVDTENWCN